MTAQAQAVSAVRLGPVLAREVAGGERFAGLFGTAVPGGVLISAHLAGDGDIRTVDALVSGESYPSVTASVGAAFWYERELHDMFGLVPAGHPRLEPLILPLPNGSGWRPRPGEPTDAAGAVDPDPRALPRHVMGPGLFTIPHGPVRSGVMESIEYLVETPGEDIPHLNMRVFYKHRGIEKRFEQMPAADGVLLAERVEGTASVAHALAYCHALERLAGCAVPAPARLVRMLHAELERIAGSLEVTVRLADAAGLAVAATRFAWHKERVLRLVGRLCGSRFGRGVVVPGGVSGRPRIPPAELRAEAERLEKAIGADSAALLDTSSFLDRLRGSGPLRPERALEHGAVGPIGRASGFGDDSRFTRPYDGYPAGEQPRPGQADGDALARLRVRTDEVAQSFRLVRRAAAGLAGLAGRPGEPAAATGQPPRAPAWRAECGPADGRGVGWAEAPQGEVLYDLRLAAGRIVRCRPRSASFHNLVLMHEVFTGDILTDFPFIEASFGLSAGGVAL
jgi:Ni,Fe-hydrogenase III large subunit